MNRIRALNCVATLQDFKLYDLASKMTQQDSPKESVGLGPSSDATANRPPGMPSAACSPSAVSAGSPSGSDASAAWAEVASHALLGGRHTPTQCIVRWIRLQQQFRGLNQQAIPLSRDHSEQGQLAASSDGTESSNASADNSSSSLSEHQNKRRKLSNLGGNGTAPASGVGGTVLGGIAAEDLSLIEDSVAGGSWSIDDVREQKIFIYISMMCFVD